MSKPSASTAPQWRFWLAIGVLLVAALYLLKSILLPFVVAIMVAYFLDPLADRLERAGLSRAKATLLITALFFTVIAGALALLLPVLYQQLTHLLHTLPDIITEHQQKLLPKLDGWLHAIDPTLTQKMAESIKNASLTILGMAIDVIGGIMQSGIALINILSLMFITPVVSFYLLRDWDTMVARLYALLPRRHEAQVRAQLHLIDEALSGFIRGQTQVCLLLGIFYAIGLSFAGLQGGVIIGLFTGLASFVPYVGMLVGTAAGLLVAWFQFETWQGVLTIAAIFAVGQLIEGNFVAPKLVGDKVGLHPVWIIFGMLSGGALFGLLGVIIAVPVTAVAGVLIRFMLGQYRNSAYYKK